MEVKVGMNLPSCLSLVAKKREITSIDVAESLGLFLVDVHSKIESLITCLSDDKRDFKLLRKNGSSLECNRFYTMGRFTALRLYSEYFDSFVLSLSKDYNGFGDLYKSVYYKYPPLCAVDKLSKRDLLVATTTTMELSVAEADLIYLKAEYILRQYLVGDVSIDTEVSRLYEFYNPLSFTQDSNDLLRDFGVPDDRDVLLAYLNVSA